MFTFWHYKSGITTANPLSPIHTFGLAESFMPNIFPGRTRYNSSSSVATWLGLKGLAKGPTLDEAHCAPWNMNPRLPGASSTHCQRSHPAAEPLTPYLLKMISQILSFNKILELELQRLTSQYLLYTNLDCSIFISTKTMKLC